MSMLRDRRWWLSLGVTLALIVLFWGLSATVAGAPEPGGGSGPSIAPALPAAVVNSRFSYQGLYREAGIPYTGPRDMVFDLFTNNTCSGVAILSLPKPAVQVTNGLFSVVLDVSQNYVYGEGLWLRPTVAGTAMGCSEILATPYALSLRPGAQIMGPPSGSTNSVLKVDVDGYYPLGKGIWTTTTTGTALRAESQNGSPIVGSTETGYAVAGYDGGTEQARGYGGYFTSTNGIGIYGYSAAQPNGSNLNAPGVYGESKDVVGVYGLSGDPTLGLYKQRAGVYGDSATGYGVGGASRDSVGTYGESRNGYGGYFTSTSFRGLYASGSPGYYAAYFENPAGASGPGLYVDGSIWVTAGKAGFVVDMAMNAGPEALETGDAVVITGYSDPVSGEIPVVKVRRASQADSTAIMGVVDQPFTLQSRPEDNGKKIPVPERSAARGADAIVTGKYLSVVTMGAYRAIKVDAANGAIHPGDLLVSSSNPGYAMRSDNPRLGTVIGKALGGLDKGTGVIPVFVMLQ